MRRAAFLAVLFLSCLGLLAPPAFSVIPGSNGRLVFSGHKDGSLTSHIYTAKPTGKGIRAVTGGKKSQGNPAWSPDHTKIAYDQHKPGPSFPGQSDIYVSGSDGSGKVLVVDGGEYPAWSPDGSQLTFAYPEVNNYEIAIADSANGSGLTMLTDSAGFDEFDPDWSPNGSQVIFVRDELAAGEHIFKVDTNGSNLVALTTGADNFDSAPRWSPDGTRIAFIRNGDVWVMDADGNNLTNLTLSAKTEWYSPAWSPDGTRIAFSRYQKKSWTIYSMAPDGSGTSRLVSRDGAASLDPDWGTR